MPLRRLGRWCLLLGGWGGLALTLAGIFRAVADNPPRVADAAALLELLLAAPYQDQAEAARALCQAAATGPDDVRQQALADLKQLDPALAKEVAALLSGSSAQEHWRASVVLAEMGNRARPAVPVLLAHARWGVSVDDDPGPGFGLQTPSPTLLLADVTALSRIAPEDEEVVAFLAELAARPARWWYGLTEVRQVAVAGLEAACKARPALCPKLIPVLAHLVSSPDMCKNGDIACAVSASAALGRLGADAAPALPALRKARLSHNSMVRPASAAAIKEIEDQQRQSQ